MGHSVFTMSHSPNSVNGNLSETGICQKIFNDLLKFFLATAGQMGPNVGRENSCQSDIVVAQLGRFLMSCLAFSFASLASTDDIFA